MMCYVEVGLDMVIVVGEFGGGLGKRLNVLKLFDVDVDIVILFVDMAGLSNVI